MLLSYNIVISPQQRGNSYTVSIDGYRYIEELWGELDRLGIIERLKQVPQLGNIQVKSKLKKTRYDYVMLQMYLHQFVRKNLNNKLKYSYSNYLRKDDILSDITMTVGDKQYAPSIGDALQVFAVAYNIGHFFNTFTASMAALNLVSEIHELKDFITKDMDEASIALADDIIESHNYHRFHLLNSLLILDKCDAEKPSVQLAKALIHLYIHSDLRTEKMAYVFEVFRDIRTFSYFIYDLPVSQTPLYLDIRNSDALRTMLSEMLDQYNNKKSVQSLLNSVDKILDDTVYNENVQSIVSYQISKEIERAFLQLDFEKSEYFDLFNDAGSVFNRQYPQNRRFDKDNVLKLTFYPSDGVDYSELIRRLQRKDNIQVGCYARVQSGGITLLVSLKTTCVDAKKKIHTALSVVRECLSFMQQSGNLNATDSRYIVLIKYLLYYLLGEYPLQIIPTVSDDVCVITKRGKVARIKEVQALLDAGNGSEDSRHEVQTLLEILKSDSTNDLCIAVCGSIVAYQKDLSGNKISEYDGIVCFPNRRENQVVFVESKNTKQSAGAKSCLKKKLKNTPVPYNPQEIQGIGNDCYLRVTI